MTEESKNEAFLKKQIQELKAELHLKEAEISKYRLEVDRANEELERIISDLTQELKLAGKIQKLLTPTEIPNIPGVEFSTKFMAGTKSGGDYFDIFELHDKLKFGILLSSCSGYSMSALFLSVLMKYTAQMEARKGLAPDAVIQLLASEIVPQIQKNETASIFYGVVDRRNYELNYCCVGTIGGILQTQGKDHVSWLEPSAGPLKKDFSEKPLAHALSLGPRDRFILCTEGVWFAQSHDQNFGKERLITAIKSQQKATVHDLRNEILFQVEQFTGLKDPDRDQTVIVTEVKDRVIKLAKKGSV